MKISKKDASLLMGLAGILIGFLVYQFYFLDMQSKTQEQESKATQLATEIVRLEALNKNREEYLTKTDSMKSEITEIVNRFPAGVLPEDDVKFAYLSDSAEGQPYIFINSMSFTAPALVYTTNQAAEAATTENAATDTADGTEEAAAPVTTERELIVDSQLPTYYLFDSAVSVGVNCDYEGLKALIDRIYHEDSRRSIDTLALAFDESTGILEGNLTMDSYYLEGTDKTYTEPSLTPVQTGTDNIFGTVTGPAETAATGEGATGEAQE